MNKEKNMINKNNLQWFFIIAVGTFLLGFQILQEELHIDEIYHLVSTDLPLSEMLAFPDNAGALPLYCLILKLFAKFNILNGIGMRVISAAGFLGTGVLGGYCLSKIFDKVTGKWFTILLFTNVMVLSLSKTVFLFSWSMFFVSGSIWLTLLFLKNGTNKVFYTLLIFLVISCFLLILSP